MVLYVAGGRMRAIDSKKTEMKLNVLFCNTIFQMFNHKNLSCHIARII